MAVRKWGDNFIFDCQRCGTSQEVQAQIVPKTWAVLTTFNEESAKYYYCGPCKELICAPLLVPPSGK